MDWRVLLSTFGIVFLAELGAAVLFIAVGVCAVEMAASL
jgi:hypothetical protein